MIKKFLFFCLIFKLSASFQDAEFDLVCSLIGNINCPCFEEYRLIENYLNNGDRSYLDVLRRSDQVETYQGRLKCISNFRLVSPGDQPPLFEHRIVNEGRTNRCILLYASSNGIYPDKARKLLREIENSGYSGHLLLRIGGFPNVANGGLKICDVPYAFKVAFLQEAKLLGFKKILWIDLAIHPLDGFEALFSEIDKKGTFFTTVGMLADNGASHLPQAATALGISPDLYDRIPHISSSMIGLNMENEKASLLLESWYRETGKGYPCLTWWPEELSLSAIAWQLGCPPTLPFGDFVCMESEQFQLETRPKVAFYLDAQRGE